MFESLNKSRTIMDGVSTEGMDFKPLKDFCGETIKVKGFFFTEGRYGKQVVVVGNGYLINMPKRATETFEALAADKEMLAAMLKGKMEITDLKMIDTKNGTTVSYTFRDC